MKKKISKKEGYKKGKEIIEELEDNDKKALQQSSYVCYDDVIEFPKPCAFKISTLKNIIKTAEKYNKKGGEGLLIGMEIKIPIKDLTPEQKKIMKKNKNVKFTTTKEIK